jgi:hypothetical protein
MIMNLRLTQPEEVEHAIREMKMEKSDANAEKQIRDAKLVTRNEENGWNTGHISAYRAAYLKSHGMEL